jgi:hypothetical protein
MKKEERTIASRHFPLNITPPVESGCLALCKYYRGMPGMEEGKIQDMIFGGKRLAVIR